MTQVISAKALRRQIEQWILKREKKDANVLLVRHRSTETGIRREVAGACTFDCAAVRSPLEVRDLMAARGPDDPTLVILTDAADLGEDVYARVFRRKALEPDAWAAVEELFRASEVDPIVRRSERMADLLLEAAPADGYAATPSGRLTAERAWREVFRHYLALDDGRPDLPTILGWTMRPESGAHYAALPEDVRGDVREWLRRSAGDVVDYVCLMLESGRADEILALGLVLRVVIGAPAMHEAALAARVRLEPYFGGHPLPDNIAAIWADAAEGVVRGWLADHSPESRVVLDRADLLVGTMKVESLVERSAILRSGFRKRERLAVEALMRAVDGGGDATAFAAAATLVRDVESHELAHGVDERRRSRTMDAALRAVRYVLHAKRRSIPGSLGEAAALHLDDDAHALRIAKMIAPDADDPSLGKVIGRCLTEIVTATTAASRRFTELLARWVENGGEAERLIGVEAVLREVVQPIADQQPVCLIVLDGMSAAAHLEVDAGFAALGFEAIEPETRPLPIVVAALPTLTAASRTSLLCGRLMTGGQGDEVREFSAHAGLRESMKKSKAPVLFHKADVRGEIGGNLAADVRDRLADRDQRVVGIVLNAIDDHLSKGDQVAVEWSGQTIAGLREILEVARAAGRIVVLTSDHGHVQDLSTIRVIQKSGDARYRTGGDQPTPDEVRLVGPRVLVSGGAVIALATPDTRYAGARRAGYHGGATPAEVLCPLAVYSARDADLPKGMRLRGGRRPTWWEGAGSFDQPATSESAGSTVSAPKEREREMALPASEGFLPFQVAADAWIDLVMNSPVMKYQRERLARAAPNPDQVRNALRVVGARGGRSPLAVFAQSAGLPEHRARSLIESMRRLLNVDGAACLDFEFVSDTIILDVMLLREQFGV